MVLSPWPKYCESSPGSHDECRLSAGWLPTLRPSQSTWAMSPPTIGSYHPHPHSPLVLLLSPQADTHFTILQTAEGWVDLGTAVRMCSPCPRLYITAAVAINTATRCVIPTLVLSHRSQMTEPLGHCNLHKLYIYWHVCNKSHLLAFNMMLTTFADKFGRCIPAIDWYLLQEPALHSKAAAAVDWQDRQMDTHPTVRDPAQQTIFWQHQ